MSTSRQQPLDDRLPAGAGMFGLKLFLASLSVLFGAGLVAYLVIRASAARRGLEFGSLHMPGMLWLSTGIMVVSSLTVHQALRAIRNGRQGAFRRAMVVTAILGLAFLTVQAPSLYRLALSHEAARAQNVFLYGLVLMLIALHAAHVIGGLVPLGVVTGRSLKGRYHADRHEGVKYCALYWHFLDVVWLIMFGTLFLAG